MMIAKILIVRISSKCIWGKLKIFAFILPKYKA